MDHFGLKIDSSKSFRVVIVDTTWLDLILNILWLFFGGGLAVACVYFILGFVFACSLVLWPFAIQLFKLGFFALFPFGKTVIGPYSFFLFSPSKYQATLEDLDYHQTKVAFQLTGNEDNFCFSSKFLYTLGNILWFPFGLILFIVHSSLALSCVVSIVGIPFAFQHVKLAQFALLPFGAFEDNGLRVVDYVVTVYRRSDEEGQGYIIFPDEQVPLAQAVSLPSVPKYQ